MSRPSARLVVDDARTFAFDAVHARTSAHGVRVLEGVVAHGDHLDEVWLDHHLGGGDTGDRVVAWLVEHADQARPCIGLVFVHSSSAAASSRMIAALRDAGYAVRRATPGDPGAELR